MTSSEYRWDKPGMPHKGWVYLDVIDTGDYEEICECCGKESIRFLHEIKHEDYAQLSVGCKCAEKLCNDYVQPKKRERLKQSYAKVKDKWLNGEWKEAKYTGNSYKVAFNHIMTIFYHEKDKCWKFSVANRATDEVFFSDKYIERHEAKAALFKYYWKNLYYPNKVKEMT